VVAPIAPTSIGTAANETTSTTTTITTTQAVAVGNTIIIMFAMDPGSGAVSVSDGHNTYTLDKDIPSGSGTSGVRTVVFSALVTTTQLASGSTITITHPSVAAKAANALLVPGLLAFSSPSDPTACNTGNTTSLTVGPTA